MQPNRNNNIIVLLLAAITFAGASAWLLNAPVLSDDFNYRCTGIDYKEFWGAEGDDISTWLEAVTACGYHIGQINGRLANLAHIMFQPAPRCIEACFIGLAIAAIAVCLVWNSRCRPRSRWWCTIAAIVLMWTALPWYDNMQSLVFEMNYSVSSVLLLCAVALYDRCGQMTRPAFAALCGLCLVTGWWHEAFGAALVAITGIYAMYDIRSRRRRALFACTLAGFAIGMIWGTLARFGSQNTSTDHSIVFQMLSRYLMQLWPLWLAMALWLVAYIRRKESRKALLQRQGTLLAAAIGTVGIAIFMALVDRALWPAQILSIVVILSIITQATERRIAPLARIACVGVFALCYAVWFCGIVKWQKTVTAQQLEIEAQMSPRGPRAQSIYYADLITSDEIPWYYLDIPRQNLHNYFNLTSLYCYYNRRRSSMATAPARYRSLRADSWPLIEGTAGMRGEWPQLFVSDTIMRHIALTMSPAEGSISPADRLILALNGNDTTTFVLPWWPQIFITAQGDTVTAFTTLTLPRSMRHRRLLRVDTLDTVVP